MTDSSYEVDGENLSTRRTFFARSLASALGIALLPSGANAETKDWISYSHEESGLTLKYPDSWTAVAGLPEAPLRYPKQCLVLTNSILPRGWQGEIPDLTGWRDNGLLLWVLYYDELVDGAIKVSGDTALLETPTQFGGFRSYVAGFHGSSRSFLVRYWSGHSVDADARYALEKSISSIDVP